MRALRCRRRHREHASRAARSSSRVTKRLSPTLLEAELAIGFQLFTCVRVCDAWRVRRSRADAVRGAQHARRERYLSKARAYADAPTPPACRRADRLRRAADR